MQVVGFGSVVLVLLFCLYSRKRYLSSRSVSNVDRDGVELQSPSAEAGIRVRDEHAIGLLTKMLEDSDPKTSLAAAHALRSMGEIVDVMEVRVHEAREEEEDAKLNLAVALRSSVRASRFNQSLSSTTVASKQSADTSVTEARARLAEATRLRIEAENEAGTSRRAVTDVDPPTGPMTGNTKIVVKTTGFGACITEVRIGNITCSLLEKPTRTRAVILSPVVAEEGDATVEVFASNGQCATMEQGFSYYYPELFGLPRKG